MFSEAYEIASLYTSPVITSTRSLNNSVNCGVGAFVHLNDEGWIITVAHLWDSFFKWKKDQNDIRIYQQNVNEIQVNKSLNEKNKLKKISKLKKDNNWLTNHSFWWGQDNRQLLDVIALPEADLVVGRLDPFDPGLVKKYPILKNPDSIKIGTSLCKLGYPFHKIHANFDEQSSSFQLAPDALPLPRFPLEGIYTRNMITGKSKNGKYDIKFLETSSPGLRGQSGGPIFDVNGVVWAIQSKTLHIPLGFSPKVIKNGKEIEENQFLNIGVGIHPEIIIRFLSDNGIKFEMSE